MKKLLTTLLLCGGLAQAQQLSPIYGQYLASAVKYQSERGVNESLRMLTDNLGSAYNKAETASRAYVCAEYVKAFLADQPGAASKKVDTGNFNGTFREQQAECERVYASAMKALPDEDNAARAMADLSIGRLQIESGNNEQKLADIRKDLDRGGLGDKFLESVVQLDLLLSAYPARKAQRLELGSTPIGTGAQVLANNQKLVSQLTGEIVKMGEDYNAQATAQQKADDTAYANSILKLYIDMLDAVDRAQVKLGKKDYGGAAESYDYAASGLSRFQLTEQGLLAKNLSVQVTVRGKTMSYNDMVRAMGQLATTASQKAGPLHTKATEIYFAKVDTWNKAAAAAFKGDRIRVFRIVNGYMLMPTNNQSFLDNAKAEIADYAKAKRWTFSFQHTLSGVGYFCTAKYTFNGDKLVAVDISSSKNFLEAVQDCNRRYTPR